MTGFGFAFVGGWRETQIKKNNVELVDDGSGEFGAGDYSTGLS